MSRDRTETDIDVTPLDLTAATKEAIEYMNKHRALDGKPLVTKVTVEDYAIVETPDGSIYALDDDGVGPDYPITDERPLVVGVWINKVEGDENEIIPMFPSCQFKLRPDGLRERATGESVNLAKYIRTFGARLDCNYEAWRRKLTQEEVASV